MVKICGSAGLALLAALMIRFFVQLGTRHRDLWFRLLGLIHRLDDPFLCPVGHRMTHTVSVYHPIASYECVPNQLAARSKRFNVCPHKRPFFRCMHVFLVDSHSNTMHPCCLQS